MDYSNKNRAAVLEEVNKYIEMLDGGKIKMEECYKPLSIFDWWKPYLSSGNLKEMKRFLEIAGELGYNGYVCFKVGASGCANGMWAHKKESETGFSPDGEVLYRSFTPDYKTWDCLLPDGEWMHEKETDGEHFHKYTLEDVMLAIIRAYTKGDAK